MLGFRHAKHIEIAECLALIRKLEKAVAVSGVCLEVPKETGKSGKIANIFRIAKCFEFQDLGHWERQTCRENLGSTLPGPCPHLLCRVFLEIDSCSPLELCMSSTWRPNRKHNLRDLTLEQSISQFPQQLWQNNNILKALGRICHNESFN